MGKGQYATGAFVFRRDTVLMTRKRKGNPDPLDSRSPQFERRQAINTHNGLRGGVAFARTIVFIIQDSRTATREAKSKAHLANIALEQLGEVMKERDDSTLPPLPEKKRRQKL